MYKYEGPQNLVRLWEDAVKNHADNLLFGVTNPERTGLDWCTYKQVGERIDNLRGGLNQIGVKKGDSVGVIANNRPEWMIAAFATYGLGGKFVPMYEKELYEVWKYIIKDAGVKVLLVSKQEIYDKIKGFVDEIPTLERIYVIESEADNSMASLEKIGQENPVSSIEPAPDDLAGLIYTSGTTGDPKGVLLTHLAFAYNAVQGGVSFKVLDKKDRTLSLLPWAHSYGQTGELYNFLHLGGSFGFMESVDTLGEDFILVRPTMLLAVPRVFNKIYDGIWAKMNEEGGAKLKLFKAALEAAKTKRELAEQGKFSLKNNIKYALLDKLVFSKIRARFGGRLNYSFTASAVMNVEIGQFFRDVGIPTFDAYGLSETAPCVTISTPEKNKLGSVGYVLPGQRVVIDKSVVEEGSQDGEIIVYGPNVMVGYHNKPEQTAAVLTEDGGFRTGDRGRLDEDGFLYITGRIKEQYKLSNGKYVFPASIEEEMKLNTAVANAMIYGDGRTFNIAIVVPDFIALEKWINDKGLENNPDKLIQNEEFKNYIIGEIGIQLKGKFGGYEVPKKFIFIPEDFTLENGMLTQTMKLKRRVVMDKYIDQIESLYA